MRSANKTIALMNTNAMILCVCWAFIFIPVRGRWRVRVRRLSGAGASRNGIGACVRGVMQRGRRPCARGARGEGRGGTDPRSVTTPLFIATDPAEPVPTGMHR